jgi:hypothetical protein
MHLEEKNLEKPLRASGRYFNINEKPWYLLQCSFVSETSLKTRTFDPRLVRPRLVRGWRECRLVPVWSTFPLTTWLCLLIIPLAVSQEVLSLSKFGVQWRQLQLVHAYNTSTCSIKYGCRCQARSRGASENESHCCLGWTRLIDPKNVIFNSHFVTMAQSQIHLLAGREVAWYDGTVGPSRRCGSLYLSVSISSKARHYHRPRQESSQRYPRDINDMVRHAMGPRGYGQLYASVLYVCRDSHSFTLTIFCQEFQNTHKSHNNFY